jgi:uncharacterized protein with HEPN domain
MIRSRYAEVDWHRIGGLRNILIHQYFGIDLEIIWDIIQTKLPDLDTQIKRIISELG